MLCNIGRIGDTILRNSILDSAFRTYATVDYVCGRHNAELIQNDTRVNRVTVLRNSMAGFASLLRVALGQRYDGYIDLKDHVSRTSLIVARLFRSRFKTGCNLNHFQSFNQDARRIEADLPMHVVERTRRIGRLARLEGSDYRPTMALAPDSIKWFRQHHAWDRPFIFLNISATHAGRIWPMTSWVRYVRGCGLANDSLLINGLPSDQAKVKQLCRELPGARAFQPRCFMDVAAAVADSRLVLTVNTGVVHACSALNKPVVAFFCADNTPIEFEPLSSWRLVIKPRTGGSVARIDAEDAIAETLRHGLPPRQN